MKTFFRYFLFSVLCPCYYTAGAGTDNNVSYLVGNDCGMGPGDQKRGEAGPSVNITVKSRYSASTNNLVFYKSAQLRPTGVSLCQFQLNSASGGGYLCCSRSNTAGDEPMAIGNQMVDSGKHYGGHRLFEALVPGLYYTLEISNIWSSYTTTNISSSGMYIGDSPAQYFRWIPESEATLYWSCNNANSSNKYQAVDGVWQSLTMELYADINFDPVKTNKVTLSRPGGYLYLFKGYGLGNGIDGHSYFLKIDSDLDNMTLSSPTCLTAALTDPSVSGSTVKMGDYSPAQIGNSATAVPFDITLQNCIHVHNIKTKLKLNKMDSVSKELLADTLTGDGAARGVGVLIKGLKNTKSAQMVLKPNDSTSVYKDYETEDGITGGIYPSKENGASQPLHFQATLK